MILTDGENAVVLDNLAWLYQQPDDDRAREYAQQAHRLAPANAGILDPAGLDSSWARRPRAGPHTAQVGHGSRLEERSDPAP